MKIQDIPFPTRLHAEQHGRAFTYRVRDAEQLREFVAPHPRRVRDVVLIGVEGFGAVVPLSLLQFHWFGGSTVFVPCLALICVDNIS